MDAYDVRDSLWQHVGTFTTNDPSAARRLAAVLKGGGYGWVLTQGGVQILPYGEEDSR